MKTEPPGKSALIASAEFIKYSLTLGTGALVLSVGLVTQKVNLSLVGSIFLIISWIAFAISIVTGVLAYSRVPVQLADKNYNLKDKWFCWPGRIHQMMFMVGVICLGVVLISLIDSQGLITPTIVPSATNTSAISRTSSSILTNILAPTLIIMGTHTN